jgi:hypothetical protein
MTPTFTSQKAFSADRALWLFRTDRGVVHSDREERIVQQNHDCHLASGIMTVKSRTKLSFIRFSDVIAGSDAFRTGACETWNSSDF